MQTLFEYQNVWYESRSDYKLEEINEGNYLKRLLFLLESFLPDLFYTFDFFILFSHNPNVVPASIEIAGKKKVLFWFSEESGSMPLSLSTYYTLIFKSYIKKEVSNIYSMPLGYFNEFEKYFFNKNITRNISSFFSGNLNHGRKKLYDMFFFRKYRVLKFLDKMPLSLSNFFFKKLHVRDLSIKKFRSIVFFSKRFKAGLSYATYMDFLARSEFVICPMGFQSPETFRHIEALHSGCIIISEKMPGTSIYNHNPFIIYQDYQELEDILIKISRQEYDLPKLQTQHRNYYNDNLEVTSVARNMAFIFKEKEG